jgi:hypothetical protein
MQLQSFGKMLSRAMVQRNSSLGEEKEQRLLIAKLHQMGFAALPFTLSKTRKVRKAVITAAGFGTRLFPLTCIVRQEFLPVVDSRRRMLPLILANVEEVIDAGIEEVATGRFHLKNVPIFDIQVGFLQILKGLFKPSWESMKLSKQSFPELDN